MIYASVHPLAVIVDLRLVSVRKVKIVNVVEEITFAFIVIPTIFVTKRKLFLWSAWFAIILATLEMIFNRFQTFIF